MLKLLLPPPSYHHRKRKATTAEEQSSGSRPSCSFCPFLEALYLHNSQYRLLFQGILTPVIERHLRRLILGIWVFGDKLAFLLTIGTLWINPAVKSSVPGVTSPCPVGPQIPSKVGLQDDSLPELDSVLQLLNSMCNFEDSVERQVYSSVSFLWCFVFLVRCLRFELKNWDMK